MPDDDNPWNSYSYTEPEDALNVFMRTALQLIAQKTDAAVGAIVLISPNLEGTAAEIQVSANFADRGAEVRAALARELQSLADHVRDGAPFPTAERRKP